VAVGLFPPPLDKLAHFAAFGLIAALLWLSLLRGRPLLVVAVFLASKWGASHFRRPKDARIDGAGVQIGHIVGCAATTQTNDMTAHCKFAFKYVK